MNFNRSRRDIVRRATEVALAVVVAPAAQAFGQTGKPGKAEGTYLIAGLTIDLATNRPAMRLPTGSYDFSVNVGNEATNEFFRVPTSVSPHSFLIHPRRAATVLGIPKEPSGGDALEIDLKERRVTRTIKCPVGGMFYGHGVFDDKSSSLFTAEITGNDNAIVVRDLMTYQVKGRLSYAPASPHDMVALHSTHTGGMLVCGDKQAVVIDIQTGRVVQTFTMPVEGQKFGHILPIPQGEPLLLGNVQSGPDQVANVFRIHGADVATLPYLRPVHGEALSAAYDSSSDVAVVTHQHADVITIWQVNQGKCLGVVDLPHQPRGVVFQQDHGRFLIANIRGEGFALSPSKPRDLQKVAVPVLGNASHLLRSKFSLA